MHEDDEGTAAAFHVETTTMNRRLQVVGQELWALDLAFMSTVWDHGPPRACSLLCIPACCCCCCCSSLARC